MAWTPKSAPTGGKKSGRPKGSKSKSGQNPTTAVRGRGFGSSQLARETGFSTVHVSQLLKKGLSVGEIKRRAEERKRKGGMAKVAPNVPDRQPPSQSKVGHHNGGRRATVVSNETYAQAELRKIIAIADQREMELAVRRGELLNAQQLNQWFVGGIVAGKDILLKMEELGDRIASETDPAKCRAMIRLEVERVLAELEGAWRTAAEQSVEPELRKGGGNVDPSGDEEEDEAA